MIVFPEGPSKSSDVYSTEGERLSMNLQMLKPPLHLLVGLSIALATISPAQASDIANGAGNTVTVLLNTRGAVSTLTSSSSTSSVGDPVTFTADGNVSALGSQILAGRMTGTVTFRDGATTLGTVSRSSRYTTLTVSSLSKGTHTITAAYSGVSNFNPVTLPPLTQSVQ